MAAGLHDATNGTQYVHTEQKSLYYTKFFFIILKIFPETQDLETFVEIFPIDKLPKRFIGTEELIKASTSNFLLVICAFKI